MFEHVLTGENPSFYTFCTYTTPTVPLGVKTYSKTKNCKKKAHPEDVPNSASATTLQIYTISECAMQKHGRTDPKCKFVFVVI